ncbi:E3 ubiquitin-protein ligase rnf146 [Chionoecetes opilio]|uniref:E3 ubiquitin-protein ligase n=1 Tax=Chionoecetes opilio TaxID=41210 RepID=A0A8J4XVL0_CHIOP|nr:E3 ubiquitin-protein ligase rnf146 [Chionoecetes opilio]
MLLGLVSASLTAAAHHFEDTPYLLWHDRAVGGPRRIRECRGSDAVMAEAAGKEETQPGTLKDKAEENEALDGKTSSPPSQQTPAKEDSDEELECAVCLQKCVHPVRLPCTHIFCFLCVKGVANQSKRCAMCRQEIPADFLDHPTLLSNIEAEKEELLPGGYHGSMKDGMVRQLHLPTSFTVLSQLFSIYFWWSSLSCFTVARSSQFCCITQYVGTLLLLS